MTGNEQLEGLKQTWGAGDFGVVAPRIQSASHRAVDAAGIGSGDKVLDVACGTGNSAIPAAKLGAEVTGLDIVPELLEQGRTAAGKAGVKVEWVEGDAENLPFDGETFDVVLSVFGCMFAPDHKAAAGEIARVLKPGGRIAICAWTPDSIVAQSFRDVAEYMPPPPPGFQPPPMWGDPDHVTGLFEGLGMNLSFERDAVDYVFDSAEAMIDELSTYFGPMVMMREMLEPQGKWEEVRAKQIASAEEDNTSTEGDLRYSAAYLVTGGTRAG